MPTPRKPKPHPLIADLNEAIAAYEADRFNATLEADVVRLMRLTHSTAYYRLNGVGYYVNPLGELNRIIKRKPLPRTLPEGAGKVAHKLVYGPRRGAA